MVVLMPDGLSRSEERGLIESMLVKLGKKRKRSDAMESDDALTRRAGRLSARYLEGRAEPTSVKWVARMTTRWASATPADGTIRISEALRAVPDYVLDYVLVHELAHLVVPGGHNRKFWDTVAAFPRVERAKGYLEAYGAQRGGSGPGEELADLVGDDGG